jgi:hypothetical protein
MTHWKQQSCRGKACEKRRAARAWPRCVAGAASIQSKVGLHHPRAGAPVNLSDTFMWFMVRTTAWARDSFLRGFVP